jgi:hypothetical protein
MTLLADGNARFTSAAGAVARSSPDQHFRCI